MPSALLEADNKIGNLHVKVICAASQRKEGEDMIHKIEHMAMAMEGTVTGEHGIGLKLRNELIEEIGDNAVNMMRSVRYPQFRHLQADSK